MKKDTSLLPELEIKLLNFRFIVFLELLREKKVGVFEKGGRCLFYRYLAGFFGSFFG
jgi:hypothetical protein